MALRKKTVDNSVRSVTKTGHSHTKQAPHFSKPNTRKKNPSNIKLSQKQKIS